MSRRRAIPEERGKIVTPPGRGSRFQWLKIVVIDQDHKGYWHEDGCEGSDFGDLLHGEPLLIVVDSSQRWADECTASLQVKYPAFNYIISKTQRTEYICDPNDEEDEDGLNIEYEVEHCSRWGLERKRLVALGMKPTTGRYPWHYVLDPANFFGYTNLGCLAVTDSDSDPLYSWAVGYREWCRNRDIRLALTKGGAASKVLRTCVQSAQYKVPIQTNARVRRHLCSSHIQTYTGFREVIEHAVEYDQTGAYHECAQKVKLPDRNDFLARGDFHTRRVTWFEPGDDEWNQLMYWELGLLCVRITPWNEAAYRLHYPYSPWYPFLDQPLYLFTNELVLAKRCGIEIVGIIAAWTSPESNSELATHASTAQAELLAADEATLEWLKPLNLAVYGVTASTPHAIRKRTLREGDLKDSPIFENVTNHVAWLGMLQAEVRKRSIMLAMDLDDAGARIATIYADAVFADVGNLDIDSLVPTYFRKRYHTNFRARKNVLCTDQTLKMPGTPKDDIERTQKADAFLSA